MRVAALVDHGAVLEVANQARIVHCKVLSGRIKQPRGDRSVCHVGFVRVIGRFALRRIGVEEPAGLRAEVDDGVGAGNIRRGLEEVCQLAKEQAEIPAQRLARLRSEQLRHRASRVETVCTLRPALDSTDGPNGLWAPCYQPGSGSC